MKPPAGESAAGFRMNPDAPYLIRDYSSEPVSELKALYLLVDSIMERHSQLVPGQMNRSMRQWRADLSTAILADSPGATDRDPEG